MVTTPYTKRWITAGLLAATVVALAAPAQAGSTRRYKGVQSQQRVVIRERSSSAAPVLAGLIGGFILGTAVSNAHTTVVHEQSYYHRPVYEPTYRYYDPYGEDWYDSLDECQYSGGPQFVIVVDVRSGQRLRGLRYDQGRWNRCEVNTYRDHRYSYRGGSRLRDRDDGSRYRGDDGRRYKNDDGDDRGRRDRGHDHDDD